MRQTVRAAAGRLLRTQEHLSSEDRARAARLLIADGVCSTGMAALAGGPFLAAFALGLGAQNYGIGLLASIGFLSQTMQIPGVVLLRALRYRRAITVACATLSRLCWLPIVLIPVFGQGPAFLVQWLFMAGILASIPGPSWNSLVHELVPPDRLGWVFSRRMMGGMALGLGLTLAGGYWIDRWSAANPGAPLYGYSVVFVVALAIGLAGVGTIVRLPEPPMRAIAEEPVRTALLRPLQDANYRRILMFMATWTFAMNMATPFFVPYMLERHRLSMLAITALATVSQITHIAFLRVWGRLADRYSNAWVLSASGPLVVVGLLLWTVTTLPEEPVLTALLLLVIHLLSGMAFAAIALASGNIAMKLSPPGQAHTYLTVFGLAGATSGAMAPLVGGLLADFFAHRGFRVTLTWSEPAQEYSIKALELGALDFLFVVSALVGLYSLVRLRAVREEGQVSDRSVLEELVDEVVLPFRSISTVDEMVRRLAAFPIRSWPQAAPTTDPTSERGRGEPCG